MSGILLQGRWKAEASGRHYVQSGRQLLIGSQLPPLVTQLAQRVQSLGARGAVEAGSRRPLGLVIAGDDRTYCGVCSTPG